MRTTNIRRALVFWMMSLMCCAAAGAYAQCSDAGACTISRHAGTEELTLPRTVALRYAFGKSGSPDDVTYHSLAAEANLGLFPRSRLIMTLPFNWQSGPLGDVNGLGDLIAIWEQTILEWNDEKSRLQIHGGLRVGTGDANANPALPMAYQPGLGSTDVIFGASVVLSEWSGGAAYQVAGGRNDNALVRLERGDQLVVWGGYDFSWDRTSLSPSLMVIKQMQESSVLESAAAPANFTSVPGSDQLQVNLALRGRHEISSILGVELFAAIPLRARDVNVDGLKRSLVLSAGLFAIL